MEELCCEIDEELFNFSIPERVPRVLSCGKSICTSCCSKLIAQGSPCPFCRDPLPAIEEIPVNRILRPIIDAYISSSAPTDPPAGYDDSKTSTSGATISPPKGSVVKILEPKGVIALMSFHGTFLRSDGNGSVNLAPHCLNWEHWVVTPVYPGIFALKCWKSRFLSGTPSRETATKWWSRDWERWRFLEIDGYVHLESIHGTYLRADPSGSVNLAPHKLEWERWIVLSIAFLQSFKGKFLRTSKEGRFDLCDAKTDSQEWGIGKVDDEYAILVSTQGKFLSCGSRGELEVHAKRSDSSLWKVVEKDGYFTLQHKNGLYFGTDKDGVVKLVEINSELCRWKRA